MDADANSCPVPTAVVARLPRYRLLDWAEIDVAFWAKEPSAILAVLTRPVEQLISPEKVAAFRALMEAERAAQRVGLPLRVTVLPLESPRRRRRADRIDHGVILESYERASDVFRRARAKFRSLMPRRRAQRRQAVPPTAETEVLAILREGLPGVDARTLATLKSGIVEWDQRKGDEARAALFSYVGTPFCRASLTIRDAVREARRRIKLAQKAADDETRFLREIAEAVDAELYQDIEVLVQLLRAAREHAGLRRDFYEVVAPLYWELIRASREFRGVKPRTVDASELKERRRRARARFGLPTDGPLPALEWTADDADIAAFLRGTEQH
jgi:hypothetical protein